MGITIIVAINGWINFEIAAAIVLGENIGTTVTAWLASLGANINAKRAARAHFIFNIAGVCWMLLLFYPFIGMLDQIMPGAIYPEDVTKAEVAAYLSDMDLRVIRRRRIMLKLEKLLWIKIFPYTYLFFIHFLI